MKLLTILLLAGGVSLFCASCGSMDASATSVRPVGSSPTAYEIEQAQRYEFDRREEDLAWR